MLYTYIRYVFIYENAGENCYKNFGMQNFMLITDNASTWLNCSLVNIPTYYYRKYAGSREI